MRESGRPHRRVVRGLTLLDHRYGGQDGTPFVLVHGIGVGHAYFARLAPLLAEHGPVHVLELPGFGRTPKPDHVLSVEEHAGLVVDVLRDLGAPVVLVGQSMGCQIVLEAAVREPRLVSRLVVIGAVTDPDERSAGMQGLRLAQDVLGEPPATNHVVLAQYLQCGPRRYLATLPSMLAYDTDAAVSAVHVPTVLLRGSRDPICRRPWARRLAARLEDGVLVEVPGAGHNVHHSRPRATASAILHAATRGRA